MCAQFQLSVPEKDAFIALDGRRMLGLSVEEFQERFPDGGDTLHAQLQLWKTGPSLEISSEIVKLAF